MDKRTLLVVGAGYGQVPAIRIGKKLGLNVIAVDRDPNAYGMDMADNAYAIDILDKKSVLEVAKKENVSGVITLQSDHGVPTVGYVNDQLGLHGISYETAMNCSFKNRCRLKLKEKKCAQPEFEIIENISEVTEAVEKIGYPCVIKAPDSSGSRGITKILSRVDIEKGIYEAKKNSKQNEIVIEEYIKGIEFGAQTFSIEGSCELVLLHNDKLSDPPYMIPIGHSFPFKELSPEENQYAAEKIKEAVEAIGINNGPANVDIILESKSREVKIIEIGARIGATCLPELIEYHTGIDWVEMAIKSSLGEPISLFKKFEKPVAAEIIYSDRDGVFQGYKELSKPNKNEVIEYEITAIKGDEVNKLRKGTDRIGKVVATGVSVDDAEKNCSRYRSQLKLLISDE